MNYEQLASQKIAQYIEFERERSVSFSFILDSLQDVGWSQAEIQKGLYYYIKLHPEDAHSIKQGLHKSDDVSDFTRKTLDDLHTLFNDVQKQVEVSNQLLSQRKKQHETSYVENRKKRYLARKHFYAQTNYDQLTKHDPDRKDEEIKQLKETVSQLIDAVGSQGFKLSDLQRKALFDKQEQISSKDLKKKQISQQPNQQVGASSGGAPANASTFAAESTSPQETFDEEQDAEDLSQATATYTRPGAHSSANVLGKGTDVHINLTSGDKKKSKFELLEERFRNMAMNEQTSSSAQNIYNPIIEDELELAEDVTGQRVPTGIATLDGLIGGGFPRMSSILLSGGAGTGKSTLALQYLVNGILKYNEPGIYITFEQSSEAIIQLGKQFGWDLQHLIDQNMLIVRDYTPEQIGKVIKSGGGSVRDMIDSIKARRLVIDSITEFTSMYESEISQRKILTNLFRSLRKWKLTTIVIGEEESDLFTHRSSVVDYEADGVVILYNGRRGDIRQRAIEVFKMRETRHTGRIFPLKIGEHGIVVNVRIDILSKKGFSV
ncbi:MAG: RAD55 family ATPase [Candidatus Woesearchaeota archaeon]